jgi:hypothetical protein
MQQRKALKILCIVNYLLTRKQINLHHFLSHTDLGSETGLGSSSWGWVSDDGREFAIIAQADGAAFAEVSKRFFRMTTSNQRYRSPPLESSGTWVVFRRLPV